MLFPQSIDSRFVIKLIPLTIMPGNKSLVLSTSNLLVLISIFSSQSSHGSLCISKSILFLIVFVFSILPENRIPISKASIVDLSTPTNPVSVLVKSLLETLSITLNELTQGIPSSSCLLIIFLISVLNVVKSLNLSDFAFT